ncbi:hypothetical protein P353_15790 [Comamonas testosteroni]|uniref:Uncharacterized protein n=1 Tax=Comamonas testosteroni TaxID=285 RepID=A0A096GSR2_COMTE|nr:hypothetical protein P353_15790 [Comamonas testosteroni]
MWLLILAALLGIANTTIIVERLIALRLTADMSSLHIRLGTLIHELTIDPHRVHKNQTALDEAGQFLLPGGASLLITLLSFIRVSIEVSYTERDQHLAALINFLLQTFDELDGLGRGHAQIEVGVVGRIRCPTQRTDSASEERFSLATTTSGRNPTNTGQISNAVSVQVEKLTLCRCLLLLHDDSKFPMFGRSTATPDRKVWMGR